MKVQLINYTGMGTADPSRTAANLMVFTKQTRLNMRAGLVEEIAQWPEERLREELEYMANTIPSSWEFVDYTFLITDVTRAFTHQFVRSRNGSYAQQTMRVLDVDGWTYGTGPTIEGDGEIKEQYDLAMQYIDEMYRWLIDCGAKIEDARGILPTNIHTNIVAKFNLRTLADMFRKRSSGRTQGEYRQVVDAMRAAVIEAHSWAPLFIDRSFDKSAAELEASIRNLQSIGLDEKQITDMVKLVDQMRMQA